MTILVTGGTGYLGSKLVSKLAGKGETVRILDNMFRERYCTLQNLDQPVEFYEGDVRNSSDIEACMDDVETVFCLSDITNAGKSFERNELTRKVNYEGVKKLYNLSEENNVSRFIYTSTASVYGNTPGVVDEEFDCDPISPYGKYKLKAEKHLLSQAEQNNVDTIALRLGTVYGHSVGMRFDTVVNYFTYLACQGKPLTVHKSALEEYRPYVDVRDVVRAYIFAMENSSKLSGENYNIIHGNKKMEGVIEAIQKVFDNAEITHVENPTDNKVSYQISKDKIRKHGFETEHGMVNGIENVKSNFENLKPVK